MNAEKAALPLHVIVNRYIIFTNMLLDAGWHVYGDLKSTFMANPYNYTYGAVRFFKKDGVTHSISVALEMNEENLGEASVCAREYNLGGHDAEFDTFKKVFDLSINIVDTMHAEALIADYKDSIIIDFTDDKETFLGFKSGSRAIFLTSNDDLITKSVSGCHYDSLSMIEAASQLKLIKNYAQFNPDDFFDLIA